MDFNHDLGSISNILELDPGTSTLTITGSAGVVIPVGNNAQRAPSTGVLRFNTELGAFEGFDGVQWTTVQINNANLTSLSSLNSTGFVTQTSTGTFTERTIAGTSGNISVTNGDGVSGNPTINLVATGTAGSGYVSVTTDSFGRVTAGSTTQAWSTITNTPTTLSGYGITDAMLAGTGALSWSAGLLTNRPVSGNVGAFYYATDTHITYYDNGVSWDVNTPAYTGDATSTAGGTTLTLATVNTTTGTFGAADTVPVLTVNGKGLVTSVTTATITPSAIGAVDSTLVGAANGIATLDGNGKLTSTQIPESLIGALQYQGVWDASTNNPTLASGVGVKGQYYKVSVTGTTTIDGDSGWQLGDFIIFNGTTWDHVDGGSSEVISVNGKVGAVSLVLASADFVNQGTTTTFLKGNASGTPSWSSVSLTTDVSGTLQASQFPALTGDITTTAGNLGTTLATVNTDVGTFGDSANVAQITVNGKGLITAVTEVAIPSAVTIGGDATGSGTTSTTTNITLATVNTTTGTFGADDTVPVVTVNGKGLVTSVTTATITPSSIGAVANAGNTPSILSDVYANIPTAGTAGALFIATDTHAIYRDNGTIWDQIGESSLLYTENASSPTASTVTGTNAVSIGSGNTVNSTNAIATGSGASTSLYGAQVHANGSFASAGDAQTGKYVLRNTTSNATPTEVFLDGSSARIVLPNNSAMTYSAYVVARRTDATGSEGAWKIEGLISRDATASTTTLVGTRSKSILTRPNVNWDVEVAADTTNGALTFNVTGVAGNTIRWVLTVITTEVSQ